MTYYSKDTDILMQFYKTLKHTPENNEYEAIVNKIFCSADSYDVKQINNIFKDYLKSHKKIKISPRTLLRLATLFSKSNNLIEATTIIESLLRKSADIDGLNQALFALSTAYQRLGDSENYIKCLRLLASHYPNQSMGINANRILETKDRAQ